MTVDRFYQECAKLLGCSTSETPVKPIIRTDRYGNPKITNSNRWGPRVPGHGRFEGFGLIRVFGKTVHIALRNPVSINRHIASMDEALSVLRAATQPLSQEAKSALLDYSELLPKSVAANKLVFEALNPVAQDALDEMHRLDQMVRDLRQKIADLGVIDLDISLRHQDLKVQAN